MSEEYAAEIEKLKAKAKGRKKKGGKTVGRGSPKKLPQLIGEANRHDKETDAIRAKAAGTNRQYLRDILKIRKEHPEYEEKIESGEMTIPQVKREIKRKETIRQLEDTTVIEAKAIEGVYDVIVVDPPWDTQKIERDCRPQKAAADRATDFDPPIYNIWKFKENTNLVQCVIQSPGDTMPKKHTYEKLKVFDELHGRTQLCIVDPKNPHGDIATIFGQRPEDLKNAKLLCESWNAIMAVAKRLGEDPLKVARKLQRGELVEA